MPRPNGRVSTRRCRRRRASRRRSAEMSLFRKLFGGKPKAPVPVDEREHFVAQVIEALAGAGVEVVYDADKFELVYGGAPAYRTFLANGFAEYLREPPDS